MKIPWSTRKKALLVIDVQSGFLNDENYGVVKHIETLIKNVKYDFYVESVFHAEKGSLWDLQTHWTLPKDGNSKTVESIVKLLKGKNVLYVEKETKSAFKGNIDLDKELKKAGIQEAHIVGLDTNDCVLATAYEAFDLGYFAYVIEECTDSSDSPAVKDAALQVLRHVNLTNNSCVEKIDFVEIIAA